MLACLANAEATLRARLTVHMGVSWKLYLGVKLFQLIWTVSAVLAVGLSVIRHPVRSFKRKKRTVSPSCLLDPSLGTHEYITANGIRFHYVTAGDRTKPLMLLLHGFPEFWYSWRYQLREFSKDYRVVAVDMRGYGETQKPVGVRNYRVEALTKDITQLIQVLSNSDGKCTLVGHDWGGIISWMVVVKHPELISSLVIMNCPHPRIFLNTVSSNWNQFMKSWYMFFYHTPWLPEIFFSLNDYGLLKGAYRGRKAGLRNLSNFTEETLEAYKYTFSQPGSVSPPINYIRNILNVDVDMSGNIEVPVLLLWGEDDPFLGIYMVEPHKEVCSNLIIHTIPNCSHWIQQDCPEEVNQYMREFLA